MNPIEFQHKRELGKIISDSFLFVRQEYKTLGKLLLKYVLPFLLIYAYLQINLQIKLSEGMDLSDPESIMQNMAPFFKSVLVFGLFSLFVQSLLIAVVYTYIENYVSQRNGKIDLQTITSRLFQNGAIVFGTALIWYVISLLGIVTFIIPGIYFANTLSLATFIVVHEKKGIGNALARSWQLVNRQWWNTLFLGIVGILFIWISGVILSFPAMLLGVDIAQLAGAKEAEDILKPGGAFWIVSGITSILTSLLSVIPFTFFAFQYFNLSAGEEK